jgi:hypothetical protein
VNRVWGILAAVAAIFPFAAVGAKIAQTESIITVIVYAAIIVILFGSLLIAPRLKIEPAPEAARGPRPPAPPVQWNWDGLNRQPGDDETTTESNK